MQTWVLDGSAERAGDLGSGRSLILAPCGGGSDREQDIGSPPSTHPFRPFPPTLREKRRGLTHRSTFLWAVTNKWASR